MDAIDRAWRLWIVAVFAGMVVVVGVVALVVIPVVQGESAGLSAYAAICRALGIGAAGPAERVSRAPPPTRVAWTAGEFAALAKADRAAGETLAQSTCVACHAADGTSADPSMPRMAGQSAYATFKELQDFKSGARVNDTMSPMAQALDDKQMADLAVYYAGLAPNKGLDAAHPSFEGPEIEVLALVGDSARALPPCAACHSSTAGGPVETPSLTGQSAVYVAAQLKAFADGSRHNDVFERMRTVAAKLTPREMTLLGDYYTTPH